MQRHRERHRTIIGQPVDHRHHARSRYRDAPPRQTIAVVVEHHFQCRKQLAIVLQRLAHAHHDHIRNNAFVPAQMPAQKMLGEPELRNNLVRCEVAAETLMPGRAKAATDGAAGLRGYTKRSAVSFGNKHGLDNIARANIEQPLNGSVVRFLARNGFKSANMRRAGELFPKRFGQVGHRLEIGFAFLMNPAEQLGGPKTFFAQPFAKSDQPVQIVAEEISCHRSI